MKGARPSPQQQRGGPAPGHRQGRICYENGLSGATPEGDAESGWPPASLPPSRVPAWLGAPAISAPQVGSRARSRELFSLIPATGSELPCESDGALGVLGLFKDRTGLPLRRRVEPSASKNWVLSPCLWGLASHPHGGCSVHREGLYFPSRGAGGRAVTGRGCRPGDGPGTAPAANFMRSLRGSHPDPHPGGGAGATDNVRPLGSRLKSQPVDKLCRGTVPSGPCRRDRSARSRPVQDPPKPSPGEVLVTGRDGPPLSGERG